MEQPQPAKRRPYVTLKPGGKTLLFSQLKTGSAVMTSSIETAVELV